MYRPGDLDGEWSTQAVLDPLLIMVSHLTFSCSRFEATTLSRDGKLKLADFGLPQLSVDLTHEGHIESNLI